MLSQLSYNEVQTLSHIGFYPDDLDSFSYNASAHKHGQGVCRNAVFGSYPAKSTTTNNLNDFNKGLQQRIQAFNYDEESLSALTGSANSTLLSKDKAKARFKSHIFNKVDATGGTGDDGLLQIAIDMIIPLKSWSLFENMPLLKGAFVEMIVQYNNCAFNFTTDASGNLGCEDASINHPINGTNPIMITSANTNEPNSELTASKTYRCSIAVGNKCLDTAQSQLSGIQNSGFQQQVQLHLNSYSMSAQFEQNYIEKPIKQIDYRDVSHYQIRNVNTSFNELLVSGISNLKSNNYVYKWISDRNYSLFF